MERKNKMKEKIEERLEDQDVQVIVYETIDSTNAEAKRQAQSGALSTPTLLVAKEQSAGRGRLGRNFLSRSGCGIYMSLLYFTGGELKDAVSVTTAAAVCVARAIERQIGGKMRIKWVNDIYNRRGKVAGILAETVRVGERYAVIVGVGINTGQEDFPEELVSIASTVGELDEMARCQVIADITDALLEHAENCADRTYMREYRDRFMLMDKAVNVIKDGETVMSGTVKGVDDEGGLLVMPLGENQPVVIRSGEVSVRIK